MPWPLWGGPNDSSDNGASNGSRGAAPAAEPREQGKHGSKSKESTITLPLSSSSSSFSSSSPSLSPPHSSQSIPTNGSIMDKERPESSTSNSSRSSWVSSFTSLFTGTNMNSTNTPRPTGSWTSPNPPTTWSHYLAPENLVPSAIMAGAMVTAWRLYVVYLRRITGARDIGPRWWRRRSLLGVVTSVGDGDGFRLFHTPGGRLAGWGWMPGRRIPTKRTALKNQTISVRLAGVDAPEMPHFGLPGQPGGREAHVWLDRYLNGRRVRVYVLRKDQYDRAVSTVMRLSWGGLVRRDVGLLMLKKGLATVYEAKTGVEFGGREDKYRRAEGWAKLFKRGIWKTHDAETPREFKERMKIN